MDKYDHLSVEAKWQKIWEEQKIWQAPLKPATARAYVLDMFPYPSAQGLHVGHPEGYTATDIYCRYLRMTGVSVLHPMGWDAFGLPAENFAIKTGRQPREVTWENIDNFRRQIKSLGFSYDWSREINTADPAYYRWTQWLFLKLYERGLAYRKVAPVNWCPSCQTVLANEQVVNGQCERCHSQVEQRNMKQWFFKITAYADRLLNDLTGLDWPASVIGMQQNWIGKSEGALVKFKILNSDLVVEIFTTRLDTIFGATYMVLAPEHPLLQQLAGQITNWPEVQFYIEQTKRRTELERKAEAKDKTGIKLLGVQAINPANQQPIPIFIADYVLMSYGTGAIMAVPAHDERDWAFAQKFKLPIKRVVAPKFVATNGDDAVKPEQEFVKREAVCAVVRNPKDDTYLCLSWKNFPMHGFVTGGIETGEDMVAAARREVYEETGYKNIRLVRDPQFVLHSLFYHRVKKQNRWARFHYLFFELENDERDPLAASEQALHEVIWKARTELKDFFSVVEGEFTLNFLNNPDYIYTAKGVLHNSGIFDDLDSAAAIPKIAQAIGAKLTTQYRLRDWLISRQRYWGAPIPIIYCQNCGEVPVPEKDLPVQLPEDVDFKPTGESPLQRSKIFHNVRCPKCQQPARRESDTMDTFVDSSWYWLRYCDPHNTEQAFDYDRVAQWCPVSCYVGGAEHAVLHLLYARFFTKALQDLGYLKFSEPFLKLRNQGLILGEDGQKMSKSRGNVVNPDDIVRDYGADTLRLYEMFMGPLEDVKPWSTSSIIGMRRFLEKVKNLSDSTTSGELEASDKQIVELKQHTARVIKKVSGDIQSFSFNTALAALMELVNRLGSLRKVKLSYKKESYRILLLLLYPFAPHITCELWEQSGYGGQIWEQAWPLYDATMLRSETVNIIVQINGKLRARLNCPSDSSQQQVVDLATTESVVAKYLVGQTIKKVIYIPGRLLNLVV